MAHLSNAEEIEKVRGYIGEAEAEFNKLEIIPRIVRRFPFDVAALELVNKAFGLAKACLALLDASFPDEAYGLSRSLVECAVNLRYLTQDEDRRHQRTQDFVNFGIPYKAYWFHQALEQFAGRPEEQEIRDYAKEMGMSPDPKAARKHWSGRGAFVWETIRDAHPLDGTALTEQYRKISYAIDYFQTSTFVHCSELGLGNYFAEPQKPFVVSSSSGDYDQPAQKVLFIIVLNLHQCLAFALFGLNYERPARLNTIFQDTLSRMEPVRRLHR